LGADLQLVPGHIGDAGKQAKAFAAESGYFDVSTLKEPYRIEGKKTMGIELAEQLGWRLPTHIVYPTGGGTGLIGMWKVFREMCEGGWLERDVAMPHMIVAQASGCAPMVRAFHAGEEKATPWENPETHASGLRVPGPLGDRLILRALRESDGDAHAVSEDAIRSDTLRLSRSSGVDAAPEGGCALAVTRELAAAGRIPKNAEVLVFNTGSGASYRF
jgi:threonine synthase